MPKVAKKIAVFGDSTATSQQGSQSRAQRIYNYNTIKFGGAGYIDHAYGGQTLASNLQGINNATGASIFGGLSFANYIQTVCDADICIINLGGNDKPYHSIGGGYNFMTLGVETNAEKYLNAEYLDIAASVVAHIQYILSAGKRPVVLGMPYVDPAQAIASGGRLAGLPLEQARAVCAHASGTNVAARCAAAVFGAQFIGTHNTPYYDGSGNPVGIPSPTNGTYDGVHPTLAYSHAVSDFIAQRLITIYGL